jgi:hypothetical protein
MAELTYPDIVASPTNGTTGSELAAAMNEIKTVVNENASGSGGDLYQQLMNDKDVAWFWYPKISPSQLTKENRAFYHDSSPTPVVVDTQNGVTVNAQDIRFDNFGYQSQTRAAGQKGAMSDFIVANIKQWPTTTNTDCFADTGMGVGALGVSIRVSSTLVTGAYNRLNTRAPVVSVVQSNVPTGLNYFSSQYDYFSDEVAGDSTTRLYLNGSLLGETTGGKDDYGGLFNGSSDRQKIQNTADANFALVIRFNKLLTPQEQLDWYNKFLSDNGLPEV